MDAMIESEMERPGLDEAKVFPYAVRMAWNAVCVAVVESTMLFGSLVLGGAIRWAIKGDPMVHSWMVLLIGAWLVGAWVARLQPGWGLGPVEELRRTVILLVVVFAGTTAMLFWGKIGGETSRLTLTLGFLLSLFLVPLARTRVKRMLGQSGRWGCPTVVYGDSQTAPQIVEALREETGLGYVPSGLFLDNPDDPPQDLDLPVLGGINAQTAQAPIAVVALPRLAREAMSDLLEGPLSGYRRVVIIPDMLEAPSLWVKPRDLVGMLGLEISVNLLDPFARLAKRTMDLGLVILAAPLWVPLCLAIAIVVWITERASPFFVQVRVGRGGRTFRALKFRTMHPDAERILQEHLARDAALREEWQRNFKLRSDPRITRIGLLLRRTSLDELPQFINVLAGNMSLVGPRPLPAYHYQQLPGRVRKLRDRVRPGVTGLWQVSGRSEAGHLGMARWDTYYVRNWSGWLDIIILVRTFRAVVTGHGAF